MVPCGTRSDKPSQTSPWKRIEMLRLAVKEYFPENSAVKIDSLEVDNGSSIPTFFLMQHYALRWRENEFWFVMGTDLISDIKTWDEGPKMLRETNFIIFERNGYSFDTSHASWPSNFKLISIK